MDRRKLIGGWVGQQMGGGQHKGSPIQCLLDKATESEVDRRALGGLLTRLSLGC